MICASLVYSLNAFVVRTSLSCKVADGFTSFLLIVWPDCWRGENVTVDESTAGEAAVALVTHDSSTTGGLSAHTEAYSCQASAPL